MKITKRNSKYYPYKISWNQYKNVLIPSQHSYKTKFIANHGCSLVAFYFLAHCNGSKKTLPEIYGYAKKNLKKYLRAKYTIKGVSAGLNKLAKKTVAKYHATPTTKILTDALHKGHVVAFEQGNPIHTVVLVHDLEEGNTYMISDGTVKKTTIAKQMKKVCKNANYKGCVVLNC